MQALKFILVLSGISIGNACFSQEFTCEDFKNGSFLAEVHTPKRLKYKIVRTENKQSEIIQEIPSEINDIITSHTVYGSLEWLDDCTYILRYCDQQNNLTDLQKEINQNGGLLTEILQIEDNCLNYKTTVRLNGSKRILYGSYCKELFP